MGGVVDEEDVVGANSGDGAGGPVELDGNIKRNVQLEATQNVGRLHNPGDRVVSHSTPVKGVKAISEDNKTVLVVKILKGIPEGDTKHVGKRRGGTIRLLVEHDRQTADARAVLSGPSRSNIPTPCELLQGALAPNALGARRTLGNEIHRVRGDDPSGIIAGGEDRSLINILKLRMATAGTVVIAGTTVESGKHPALESSTRTTHGGRGTLRNARHGEKKVGPCLCA